jgi:hypothetical protein
LNNALKLQGIEEHPNACGWGQAAQEIGLSSIGLGFQIGYSSTGFDVLRSLGIDAFPEWAGAAGLATGTGLVIVGGSVLLSTAAC